MCDCPVKNAVRTKIKTCRARPVCASIRLQERASAEPGEYSVLPWVISRRWRWIVYVRAYI